jgi:hypothetical protein
MAKPILLFKMSEATELCMRKQFISDLTLRLGKDYYILIFYTNLESPTVEVLNGSSILFMTEQFFIKLFKKTKKWLNQNTSRLLKRCGSTF